MMKVFNYFIPICLIFGCKSFTFLFIYMEVEPEYHMLIEIKDHVIISMLRGMPN